jgi:hypothetical protein
MLCTLTLALFLIVAQRTGVLPFTGGVALIYGHAISSEGGMDCVRPLMGVCPQF